MMYSRHAGLLSGLGVDAHEGLAGCLLDLLLAVLEQLQPEGRFDKPSVKTRGETQIASRGLTWRSVTTLISSARCASGDGRYRRSPDRYPCTLRRTADTPRGGRRPARRA